MTGGRRIDALVPPDGLGSWLAQRAPWDSGDGAHYLAWPATARILHSEATLLRAAIRDLFVAHSTRAIPDPQALFAVNRVLQAGTPRITLEATEAGFEIVASERAGTPLALLAPIARAAAEVVTTADPLRLRCCAAPECATWFVDSSKGGRRRWCSMARCGNRHKAARHRGGTSERT